MRRIKNDDEGYEAWRENHPNGFILNFFGGSDPSYNPIHRASCPPLSRPSDQGRRTVYEKVCCIDLNELEKQADELLGKGGWKHCAGCMG